MTVQRLFIEPLSILLLVFGVVAASAAAYPAPFAAHYDVYAKGIYLGTGTIALEQADGKTYRIRLNAEPEGLAGLILDAQIEEQASGQFTQMGPRPLQYRYHQREGDGGEQADLHFDWENSVVQIAERGESPKRLALPARAVDPLSLYVQVMWDLLNGNIAQEYQIVQRDELREYAVTHEGQERIKTGIGTLQTERYQQVSKGGKRVTTLWLSRAHQYLPTRIVQTRKGKEHLRMELRALD